MIESILKPKPRTFYYGTVIAVNDALQQVQVQLRSDLEVWVQSTLDLSAGDPVILAENDQDKSKFIMQHSRKALPSQGTLLLV